MMFLNLCLCTSRNEKIIVWFVCFSCVQFLQQAKGVLARGTTSAEDGAEGSKRKARNSFLRAILVYSEMIGCFSLFFVQRSEAETRTGRGLEC